MNNSNLPNHWELKPLSAVVSDTTGGYGFPRNFQGRHDLPYPFAKVSDMNLPGNETYITSAENTVDNVILNKIRAKTYFPGTIIFPKVGGAIATNKKRILGVEATFDNNVMAVIPNEEKAITKWIFYYLQSIDLMILANIGPVPSIRQSTVQALPIPIPYPDDPPRSLDVQRRIVARIEALLGEVREMRQLQADIEENTNRLMRTVLAQTYQELSERYEPTDTSSVCQSITDGSHSTPPYVESGVPFLFVRNIVNRFLDFSDTKFVTQGYFDSLTDSRTPTPGDILYSVVGSYGVPVVVDVERDFCFQRHIAILKPNHDVIDSEFLCWMLDAPQVLDQAHKVVTGSAQQTLALTYLRKLTFPFPPLVREQKRIVAHLNSVQREIKEMRQINENDAKNIEVMEQAILAQAFRGEL